MCQFARAFHFIAGCVDRWPISLTNPTRFTHSSAFRLNPAMSMSVGERDKKMSNMASIAAEVFCEMHTPLSPDHIRNDPEMFLKHTVPYITVRTLHKLQADSRWIKAFAIITGILTAVLVGLTIVLAFYAFRLDTVTHLLQSNASPTPSPTATPSPTPTGATATP
jgi:hypothetical protein